MRWNFLALLLLLPAQAVAGTRLTGSTESIPRQTVNGGGGRSSGLGYILAKSFAENGVGSFTGAGLRMNAGLMHITAQPGTITALTALSKSTGTVELAWTAPGVDGFLGNVIGGYYRIDASSDPLHVFSPGTFLAEFSTSVVAGSAQSYVLTGLLPNTTYFARVYLADTRKVVAEDSAPSTESTLANLPAAPVVSGVYSSSVTITWNLPAGGAAGFRMDSSSTQFGALTPGGLVLSSATNSPVVVTMTIDGLDANTTYFFKLGSLNWQQDVNFYTILTARTLPGGPGPVQNLALSREPRVRRVTITWSNPVFLNPAGVLVQVSSSPISSPVVSGTAYAEGTVLPDGSVVRSTAAGSSFLQGGLDLDTTQYFALYSRDTSNVYSVAVSTLVVLDLPPMAPAGLLPEISPDRTQITLRWASVSANSDGTPFKGASPTSWEVSRYVIYRSTGIIHPNWVQVGNAAANASSYTEAVPDPNGLFFYRVVSVDAFSAETDVAMIASNLGDLYALAPDQISRLRIPAAFASALQPTGNASGKALLVRAEDRPQDLSGNVMKSVSFDAVEGDTNRSVELRLPDRAADVALRYEVSGGKVVPSSAEGTQAASAGASAAAGDLSAYWYNGREYVKLYGKVDLLAQTVSVQSSMPGSYQIRTLQRAQGTNFDVSGMSNKVITPNGDNLNDTVVFTFDNPNDSAYSGKIYDLRGARVADMQQGPVGGPGTQTGSLRWDGKANGQAVSRGVYIYQIEAEGKKFSGTVLVIR